MRRLAALALGLMLAACVTAPVKNPAPSSADAQAAWLRRQASLAALSSFDLNGRISLGGLAPGSGGIHWQQRDENFTAEFSGSLGVAALRIEGGPDEFTATSKDGVFYADQAQALVAEKLGGPLPVAALRFWVLGIPQPDAPSTYALDPEGRLTSLDQDGWHIDYLAYQRPVPPISAGDLPKKLKLSLPQQSLRVVVDEWRFP